MSQASIPPQVSQDWAFEPSGPQPRHHYLQLDAPGTTVRLHLKWKAPSQQVHEQGVDLGGPALRGKACHHCFGRGGFGTVIFFIMMLIIYEQEFPPETVQPWLYAD